MEETGNDADAKVRRGVQNSRTSVEDREFQLVNGNPRCTEHPIRHGLRVDELKLPVFHSRFEVCTDLLTWQDTRNDCILRKRTGPKLLTEKPSDSVSGNYRVAQKEPLPLPAQTAQREPPPTCAPSLTGGGFFRGLFSSGGVLLGPFLLGGGSGPPCITGRALSG